MQRRNVDLPEPEAPIMQTTSPGWTSRETPRRTSRRPKRLCTPSALTIGSALVICSHPVTNQHVLAQSLKRRLRKLPRRAPTKVAFEVVLPEREHCRDDQVPDARHYEQWNRSVVDRIDQLHRIEQIGDCDDAHERRRLEH